MVYAETRAMAEARVALRNFLILDLHDSYFPVLSSTYGSFNPAQFLLPYTHFILRENSMGDRRVFYHLSFNSDKVWRALRFDHIDIIAHAQDDDQSSPHWHALVAWPTRTTPRATISEKPSLYNFNKRWRLLNDCVNCRRWRNGNYCYFCAKSLKRYPKIKTAEHLENCYKYIAAKPGATLNQPLQPIRRGFEHLEGKQTTTNHSERSTTRTTPSENI